MDRFVRSARSVRSAEQSIPGTNSSAHQRLYGLSLRANFAWTFVGNVIYAGCQWAMLVVLAKMGNPETVGRFALALAVTAPVLMLANLQLRAVQATDARQEYTFGHYFAVRLITTFLALLAIAIITLISGYTLSIALVVLVMGLAKCFESISDVVYGVLQQNERMDKIAISMTIKGILSLAALAAGIYLTGELLWGVVALAFSWAAIMFAYDLPNAALILHVAHAVQSASGNEAVTDAARNTVRPNWARRRLVSLMWLSLPLGVVMFLISLNTNIPRYLVEHYLGTQQLGIFTAMAYLLVAGSTVITALGQAASPRLAQYHARQQRKDFRGLALKLLLVGALLGIGGVLVALLAGREILTVLYSTEYATYLDVFVWIMLAAGLWNIASVLGYVATAQRRLRYQPAALFAIVLVSIVSGYFLIPSDGLWGAGISMVISSVVAVVAYALLLI